MNVPELQLANRQFPIFDGDGVSGSNVVKDVPYAQVNGNVIQRLKIPWDETLEEINMVKIGNDYYNVINIDNVTYYERETVIDIIFNPVTTYLKQNDAISGWWERTPSLVNKIAKIQVMDDQLKYSRKYNLENLGKVIGSETTTNIYIQIVAKEDIGTGDQSTLTTYGTFAIYDPKIYARPFFGHWGGGDFTKNWVTLWDVLTNPDKVIKIGAQALDAVNIMDIAVSPRCPWNYLFTSGSGFNILNPSNGIASNLLNLDNNLLIQKINKSDAVPRPPQSISIHLEPFERMCGKMTVVDELGNDVFQIPNEYLDSNGNLTITSQCISDINGIYTIIKIVDKVVVLQEGKLPWIGDAWTAYCSATREYDREAMVRALETVDKQKQIDMYNTLGNGLVNTSIAGALNPIGAAAGLASMSFGIYANEQSAILNKKNIEANQIAKEGLVKASPSPAYMPGYGLDYLYKNWLLEGANIRIDMPAYTTQTDFDNYVKYRGYPCDKYADINIVDGYVKGNLFILPVTSIGTGPKLDMLRKEIADGFRMVMV